MSCSPVHQKDILVSSPTHWSDWSGLLSAVSGGLVGLLGVVGTWEEEVSLQVTFSVVMSEVWTASTVSTVLGVTSSELSAAPLSSVTTLNNKKIHDVTRQTSPLVEVLVQPTDSVSLLLQHFPENIFLSLETEIIILAFE